jgi:hypothetical protein
MKFISIASNEMRIVGRVVKESVATQVDYYAGEELRKDDGNPNLDKKSGVSPLQLQRQR